MQKLDDEEQITGAPSSVLHTLHRVSMRVHASLDLTATLQMVAEGVCESAGFGMAVVNLVNDDGDYEVVAVAGDDDAAGALLGHVDPRAAMEKTLELTKPLGELRFIPHAVETPDVLSWVPDLPEPDENAPPDSWHPNDTLLALLTTPEGEHLGMLSVDVPRDGRWPGPEQRDILELFAAQAALAIARAQLFRSLQETQQRLEHAALHDPLTEVGNRAMLHELGVPLCARPGAAVGVLILDLNRFKEVNDTAGHAAGDEVLRAVAGRLRGCVRDDDVVARMGGDEFVVVMSGQGPLDELKQGLERLAHRLHAVVAEPIRGSRGSYRVEASIGTASAACPADLDDLVRRADHAMYRQKPRR